MQYRSLGKSGLIVSELALGTMIFGEESQRSTPPAEAIRLIHRYLDAGGNHIDTANVYAAGRSEEIIGEALKGRWEGVVLATKVRFATGDGPNAVGLSRYHILQAVEESLRRLKTDHVDLLYMHAPDPLTPIDESLRAFEDLVTSGKVRYIGVSNFKAWQLMKALSVSDSCGWSRFIAAQYQYSLVNREIEDEFVDLCLSEGVGLVPWGPLGGGFLSGKYSRDRIPGEASQDRLATTPDHDEEAWVRRATQTNWEILEAIDGITTAHEGSSPSQIAISWLLAQLSVASVVIGVRTEKQLEDNLGAVALQLTQDDIVRLNAVSALPKGYPYRYLENYGGR